MRRHRTRRRGAGERSVAVIDATGQMLAPCAPVRARQLVRRGRARFLSNEPPLIELIHREHRHTRGAR
jgi:hypothetical protein